MLVHVKTLFRLLGHAHSQPRHSATLALRTRTRPATFTTDCSAKPQSKAVIRQLKYLPTLQVPYAYLSFYRFTALPEPLLDSLRKKLLEKLLQLNCRGRIYIAKEGINAQLSCPKAELNALKAGLVDWHPSMSKLEFNISSSTSSESAFRSLFVKVKQRLVNDGEEGLSTDMETAKQALHVSPEEFHNMLLKEKQSVENGAEPPLLVDLRNHYESEIGHFDGSFRPPVVTYREGVALLRKALIDKQKDRPVYMYCTGGIRCSRTGSMLAQEGWDNVVVLKGGITAYSKFIKETPGVKSLYRGKNYTFDVRLGEPVTDDIVAHCHTCPTDGHKANPCDALTNCINRNCNLLFIQCPTCRARYHGSCGSKICMDLVEEAIRQNKKVGNCGPQGGVPDHRVGNIGNGSLLDFPTRMRRPRE